MVKAPQKEFFVGRREELRQLLENIRSGTHTLLLGHRGIGKSALLRQALLAVAGELPRIELSARVNDLMAGRLAGASRPSPMVISVSNASPLGDCLREMAKLLWDARLLAIPDRSRDWEWVRKQFAGLGRIGQRDLILDSLRAAPKPLLVAFDSLDGITPSHQRFLEDLFEVSTVVAAASRTSDAIHYRKIWSTFSRIEVGPLPRREAEQMLEELVRRSGIRGFDREFFAAEVLKSSANIPFHIRLNVWRLSRRGELDRRAIRSLRSTEEGDYFNMGPIYIFGASIFTLYKILSIGMDNREFYIYFSALGFFVYLAFRVFRNFFLFRPQRKR